MIIHHSITTGRSTLRLHSITASISRHCYVHHHQSASWPSHQSSFFTTISPATNHFHHPTCQFNHLTNHHLNHPPRTALRPPSRPSPMAAASQRTPAWEHLGEVPLGPYGVSRCGCGARARVAGDGGSGPAAGDGSWWVEFMVQFGHSPSNLLMLNINLGCRIQS